MKFLVVDGLRSTRLFFKEQILSITPNAEVYPCVNAEDAVFNLIDVDPDIIISSEILSFRSGFDIVRLLNKLKRKLPVIIVANDSTNALEAIRSNVFDFLLNPVEKEILRDSIARAVDYIDDQLLLKYGNKKNEVVSPKIRLSTTSGYKLIDLDKIAYFKSDGAYTIIHYANGESDVSSYFLGRIEKIMVDYHFMRISRSVIINLKNIHSVDRSKRVCMLETSKGLQSLSISSTHLKRLEEADNMI